MQNDQRELSSSALWCFIIGIIPTAGCLILLIQFVITKCVYDSPNEILYFILGIAYYFGMLAAIAGLLLSPIVLTLGIISIVSIKKAQKAQRGIGLAITGMIMTLMPAALFMLLWWQNGIL